MSRSLASAAALVLLLVSACGSTASKQSRSGTGASSDTAGGGSANTEPGRPGSAPGRNAAGGGGSSLGGEGGSGAAAAGPGSTTKGGRPVFARGVTAKEIRIGRTRISNAGAANAAIGVAVPAVDTDTIDKSLVDDINRHGGIGGRKLKIVYFTYDANSNESQASADQRACTLWTQDQPVYMVLSGTDDTLKTCLAKHGIAQIYENVFSGADDQTLRQFPHYFEVNAVNITDLAKIEAEGLFQQGFFKGGQKIGLLTFDRPSYHRAVDKVLKPTLAGHHLKLSDENYFIATDQSAALASMPGVVLKFKNDNIQKVIIFGDSGAGIFIFFSRQAQSQGYHPNYGIESGSAGNTAMDSGYVDPSQAVGARMVGWNPEGDIGTAHGASHPAGFDHCMKVLKDHGYTPPATNDRVVALRSCDGFYFLRAAVNAGLPSISLQSITAGAESLKATFPNATAYGTLFGTTRHSGVNAVRYASYDGGCNCFKYTSGIKRFD